MPVTGEGRHGVFLPDATTRLATRRPPCRIVRGMPLFLTSRPSTNANFPSYRPCDVCLQATSLRQRYQCTAPSPYRGTPHAPTRVDTNTYNPLRPISAIWFIRLMSDGSYVEDNRPLCPIPIEFPVYSLFLLSSGRLNTASQQEPCPSVAEFLMTRRTFHSQADFKGFRVLNVVTPRSHPLPQP